MSDQINARMRVRREHRENYMNSSGHKSSFFWKLFDTHLKPIHDKYILRKRLNYLDDRLSALPTSDSSKREFFVAIGRFIKSTNDHKELIKIFIRHISQQRSPEVQREIAKRCGELVSEFDKNHYEMIRKNLHLRKDDNKNTCTRKGMVLLLSLVGSAESKEILLDTLKFERHAKTKEEINSVLDEMK